MMRGNPKRADGFTLLEVMLAAAIFLLLAGGIFAAVSVTMKAAAEIAVIRLESERLDAMQRFLRQVFSNLPASTRLELRIRSGGSRGNMVELLLWPVPELASFSSQSQATGGLALTALPDGAGAYSFSLANFDAESSPANRDQHLQGTVWTPLLPGLKDIRWRFTGAETSGLQETWEPANGRPGLADLEVTLADGSRKHWQFLIPQLLPVSQPPKPNA